MAESVVAGLTEMWSRGPATMESKKCHGKGRTAGMNEGREREAGEKPGSRSWKSDVLLRR